MSVIRGLRWSLLLAALAVAFQAPAQSPPASTKKELVARVLQVQRAGIEGMARAVVEQPAALLLQQAGLLLQQRGIPERRVEAARSIQADAQQYSAETVPQLRALALEHAPATIGGLLEDRFSEDELRQLIAWLEAPIAGKYQQLAPELDRALREKLVTEGRATVEPKLRALESSVRRTLESAMQPASAPAR